MIKVPFGRPDISKKEINRVIKVLKNPILAHGPLSNEFEKKFSNYTGSRFATTVSSCTAGMHLFYLAYEIKKGDEGKRIFEFTNVGTAPLIIKEIKTSCDCAIPKKPEKPIMPGEKTTLTVEYDTSKVGGFSKEIIIFSNAKEAVKRIKIKGYISK